METVPALFIAKKFGDFISVQGEVLGNLGKLSRDNLSSSQDLKRASTELSSSSTEQANAVQETVSALAEIKSMIKVANDHVDKSNDIVEEGGRISQSSQSDLEHLSTGMNRIQSSVKQLEQIIEIVDRVKQKTSIINDIVFKTQLLSFNASIEAARAGQHGKGFADVAEEVGKLAQLSGTASNDIDELLIDSNKKVAQIVESISKNVENGTNYYNNVASSFDKLTGQFAEVESAMGSIISANDEKVRGIEEVSRAMEQLSIAALRNLNESDVLNTSSMSISENGAKLDHLIQDINKRLDIKEDVQSGATSDEWKEEKVADLKDALSEVQEGENLDEMVNQVSSKFDLKNASLDQIEEQIEKEKKAS